MSACNRISLLRFRYDAAVMPSERIQRRIDGFLDEAEVAAGRRDWAAVLETARAVLAIEAENDDARAFFKMAEANGAQSASAVPSGDKSAPSEPSVRLPASFAGGRYAVSGFLGEGGSKRVYLARDTGDERAKVE